MNHETTTSGTHQHKYHTPYDEGVAERGYFTIDCTLCAGNGDYSLWTKRDACVFCYVEVTVDNIGLTVDRNFHICSDCIHTEKGLEFLESQGEAVSFDEYEGWKDEPDKEI